jgi:hypothetical protein
MMDVYLHGGTKMGGKRGGARPGAGRKKTGKIHVTMSIVGRRDEIAIIREKAEKENKSISRYVIDIVKKSWELSDTK